MSIVSLRAIRAGLLLAFTCSMAIAADPPPPDWVMQQPLAKIKRWFLWQDVTDPSAQQMLAEAADSIAAFLLEINTPD